MGKFDGQDEVGGVSVRVVETGVAVLIMAFGALVMADSRRTGMGWSGGSPEAGYFPFYVGLLMFLSSGLVLARALFPQRPRQCFVEPRQAGLVLALLIPSVIFVGVTAVLGIYVAGALYLAYFMIVVGKYRALVALPIAIGVPLVLFLLFEVWFLVPLPKGPLEYWLGF